jgi:hypothetical protein
MPKLKELPDYCFYGGEPYKNYMELSIHNDKQTIIDIGTYRGHSAFAWASNRRNNVHTFDIADYVEIELPDNVTVHHKGGLEIPKALIKSANIILLDVDPHDGIKEPEIFKHIVKSGFKGLLICDDICLNEEMKDFWDSIEHKKEIVYWHHSGTGLVYFNG